MIKKNISSLKWEKRFCYLKNVLFDEKDLKQEGARFQIIRFLPKTRIEPHFHEKVCEIFYIQSGKGTIIMNDESHDAKKDDIFLCQPGDIHEIVNDSDEELVMLIFKTNESADDLKWTESSK